MLLLTRQYLKGLFVLSSRLVTTVRERHTAMANNTAIQQESLTRAIWRAADAVCFDIDSTVCRDEAIDELAKFAGKEKEVTEM